jgi:type IV fimbrial biogenesis protein FimT
MKQNGYTLIECMVALTIISAVLGMGVPSFHQLLRKQVLDSARMNLVGAIQTTRQEAVYRNRAVTLIQRNGDWANGWTIMADVNSNGALDSADIVIRQQAGPEGDVTLSGNSPVSQYIRYIPDGTARLYNGAFQAGTLTLCHAARNLPGIKLVLSSGGRLRQEPFSCS